MNHLLRELAPISDASWRLLESEAKQRLTPALAARRVVDFSGPHGWEHSATNLGRTVPLASTPVEAVSGRQRQVLPVIELRADFELSAVELADADRGADNTDLGALDTAAHQLAAAENAAVFHGWEGAIDGISESSPHDPIALGATAERFPTAVAGAIDRLLASGVAGPYALALDSERYRLVIETAEGGGYPLAEHLREMIGGPIVWTPGARGAIVVSQRGGDFILDSGQDVAIGYASHDADGVRLYLEESFSFHVATPEAAVVLAP